MVSYLYFNIFPNGGPRRRKSILKCAGFPMARVSTKESKNIYQLTREGLKLTRETASELLETIPPERTRRSRTSVPCRTRTRC